MVVDDADASDRTNGRSSGFTIAKPTSRKRASSRKHKRHGANISLCFMRCRGMTTMRHGYGVIV